MKKLLFILPLLIPFLSFSQFGEEHVISHKDWILYSPFSFHVADLDGDGDQDVVVGSYYSSDNLGWYENLGSNKYGHFILIDNVSESPSDVDAADMDNDGDMDIIASFKDDQKVVWYPNNSGVFGSPITVSSITWEPYAIRVADFDGDSDLDVVSACYEGDNVVWNENLGAGVFGPDQQITNLVDGVKQVDTADFNNDGFVDVLSMSRNPGGTDKKIAWYSNDGLGNFGAQQIVYNNLAMEDKNALASDIDGDGDFDIVASSIGSDKISWFENDGLGNFSTESDISDGTYEYDFIAVGDLNGDNIDDVVGSESTGIGFISIFLNSGAGTFSLPVDILYDVKGVHRVYIHDMDGDGDNDVVYTAWADEIAWIENLGGGTFGNQHFVAVSTFEASEVLSFDANQDGFNDIISLSALTDRILWHKNDGGGIFSSSHEIDKEATLSSIQATTSDFNNDGLIDILTGSDYGTLYSWYENQNGGSLSSEISITGSGSGFTVTSIESADINNDGFEDVLAVENQSISWFENFHPGFSNANGVGPNHYESAFPFDMDNDGDIDIMCTSDIFNKVRWYENLAFGTFGSYQDIQFVLSPIDGFVADFNGDSIGDIVTNGNNAIYYLEGLGGATYASNVQIGSQTGIVKMITGDIDDDGDPDLLVASSGDNTVAWYENLNGTFGTKQIISDSSNAVSGIAVSDIDNDGDLDVSVSSYGDGKISWFENYLYGGLQASGHLYIDHAENGIIDSNDNPMLWAQVLTNPSNSFAYTGDDGNYFINFNFNQPGPYTLAPTFPPGWKITSDSLQYNILLDANYTNADSLDFGFYPDSVYDALNADIVGSWAACNQTSIYWIQFQNIGTTVPSGVVHLKLDDSITFVNAFVPPDSISGQNIYWSYDSLNYFGTDGMKLRVLMPNFMSINDTVTSYLSVTADSLSGTVFTAYDTLSQFIVCAYDPNDKIAEPAGIDSLGFIPLSTNEIEYTIRFQNTGTDTAHSIVIEDYLDQNLNWSTLQPISSSHSMDLEVYPNGLIKFVFDDIKLLDSNANEPESHGYVKYKINLLPSLNSGTQIKNTAHIFFDSNPAVITNTKLHTLFDCDSSLKNAIIPTVGCENDVVIGSIVDATSASDYNWELDSFYIYSGQNWNWIADTAGTFNLKVTISNQFCTTDTILSLNIEEDNPPEIIDSIYICQGESTSIFGNLESIPGIYSNTLMSINGCDSTIQIVLLENPTFVTDLPDVYVCPGESAIIFGGSKTIEGIYHDTLTSMNGCDSILQKELIFYPILTTTLPIMYNCQGDSTMVFGNFENIPGFYYDTLNSINGCDSILEVELDELAPQYSLLNDAVICPGDSTIIFGNYQVLPGIYVDTLSSSLGCDSILMMSLVHLPTQSSQIQYEICQGDSILIYGNFVSSSGIYTDSLSNSYGCDSIINTELIVNSLPNIQIQNLNLDTSCIYHDQILLTGSPLGGNFSGTGVTGSYFNPTIAGVGNHWVYYTFTDNNLCSSIDSIDIYINDCLGLTTSELEKIKVYPNPATSEIIIDLTNTSMNTVQVELYDGIGKKLKEVSDITAKQFLFETAQLSRGVYYLKLSYLDEHHLVKLVIQQ